MRVETEVLVKNALIWYNSASNGAVSPHCWHLDLLFCRMLPLLWLFVVFLEVGPRVHVDIFSCEERNQTARVKVAACGRQISGLTVLCHLRSPAGTSVGDDDDDDGQDHVCPNDAGYRPRLNPVARHRAVWWEERSDRWKRGEGWKYQPQDWLEPLGSFILKHISLKSSRMQLLWVTVPADAAASPARRERKENHHLCRCQFFLV